MNSSVHSAGPDGEARPLAVSVTRADSKPRVIKVDVYSTVRGGLRQHNPTRLPDTEEKVRLGQEAMARLRRGWEDWLAIGEAIAIGRTEVMRELGTDKPQGRRYENAMGDWLLKNSFKEIDKGTRSRLLDCLEHQTKIEAWRKTLTAESGFV